VHAATLPDGTRVAVKVQHPDLAFRLALDMSLLRGLAELACWLVPTLRVEQTVAQFASNFEAQLDFRDEAANLEAFRRNFSSSFWQSLVSFPRPISGLVAQHVLVETNPNSNPNANPNPSPNPNPNPSPNPNPNPSPNPNPNPSPKSNSTPTPIPKVETFEPGESVASFLDTKGELREGEWVLVNGRWQMVGDDSHDREGADDRRLTQPLPLTLP